MNNIKFGHLITTVEPLVSSGLETDIVRQGPARFDATGSGPKLTAPADILHPDAGRVRHAEVLARLEVIHVIDPEVAGVVVELVRAAANPIDSAIDPPEAHGPHGCLRHGGHQSRRGGHREACGARGRAAGHAGDRGDCPCGAGRPRGAAGTAYCAVALESREHG